MSLVTAGGSLLLALSSLLVTTQLMLEKYKNVSLTVCGRDGSPAFARIVSLVSVLTPPQTPAEATKGLEGH